MFLENLVSGSFCYWGLLTLPLQEYIVKQYCEGWSGYSVVVKTFKNSTAERVPSECSQLRYTSDILEYLFKSTAERVPSECS